MGNGGMIAVMGILSKKEYIRGDRAFCWRTLQAQFPSKPVESTKGEKTYPEPLKVVKI